MSEALRLAELVDYHSPIDFDGHLKRAAAELRRLASVEQELEASQAEQLEQCRIIGMSAERELALRAELEALKRAISYAEPVAWSTGIKWHPVGHYQSEQVQKLTRKSQPEYGFTEPLYTLKGIK